MEGSAPLWKSLPRPLKCIDSNIRWVVSVPVDQLDLVSRYDDPVTEPIRVFHGFDGLSIPAKDTGKLLGHRAPVYHVINVAFEKPIRPQSME